MKIQFNSETLGKINQDSEMVGGQGYWELQGQAGVCNRMSAAGECPHVPEAATTEPQDTGPHLVRSPTVCKRGWEEILSLFSLTSCRTLQFLPFGAQTKKPTGSVTPVTTEPRGTFILHYHRCKNLKSLPRSSLLWHSGSYTVVYKGDDWWEPTVELRELCSVLCGDLNGKETQGRGAVWIRIAESLSCTTETSTAF